MSARQPLLRPDGLPYYSPKGTPLQWIRTSKVAKHGSPYNGCWPDVDKPISMDEIDACLAAGQEQLHPEFDWDPYAGGPRYDPRRRREHIEKIAWFVRHGFQEPLEVDVGCPVLNFYVKHKVTDGNHRLAAALYRASRYGEDPLLPLSVGGEIEYAIKLGLWEEEFAPPLDAPQPEEAAQAA